MGMTPVIRLVVFGGPAADLDPFVPPPAPTGPDGVFLAAEDGAIFTTEDGAYLEIG